MNLEQRIRDVLAKASVVAEAGASAMGAPTKQGKPGSAILASVGPSLLDRLERRLRAAESPAERLKAVEWAEHELRKAKRQAPREMTAKQTEYWILVETQGKDYQTVAQENDMRPETVWKIRRDCKPPLGPLDPRTGRPKAAKKKAA